jgi:hypothetical protein
MCYFPNGFNFSEPAIVVTYKLDRFFVPDGASLLNDNYLGIGPSGYGEYWSGSLSYNENAGYEVYHFDSCY